DIAKRDLRNSTKERQKLTEKWEGTFGVLQRKIADYNGQQDHIRSLQQQNEHKQQQVKEQEKQAAEDKIKIDTLTKQIKAMEQQLAVANAETEKLEDQWMVTQEELSNCEVRLSQINASKDAAKLRSDRYKTKIEALGKAKPSATAVDPKERHKELRSELKRKTKQLKLIKENSLLAQQNVDGLKNRLDEIKKQVREQRQKILVLQKKKDGTAEDSAETNSDESDAGSVGGEKSRPSSKESGISSHEHSNQSLPEIDAIASKRRRNFVAERAQEGKVLIEKERKKLQDSVSLLTAETKRLESMNANLQAEIEKVSIQEQKMEKQVAHINKSLAKQQKQLNDLSKSDEQEESAVAAETVDEAPAKIEELRAEKSNLESQRTLLKSRIKEEQANLTALKGRFEATQVAASTTSQANWLTRKQVKRIETDHAEWKAKLEAAEDSLIRLNNTLDVASGRNQVVRENLTTIKPYSDENIEHKKLRDEYAQTQHELDETQKRILSLQLQLRKEVQLKTFTK
uniref:Uncharacterized protein n=1 Tax=Plectus sambesii TaxID=2011161 RepID=A0A914UI80_9BILA